MPACSIGHVHGIVLAGGLSRRMGRDKADVVLRGRTLLERTCARLAPQCTSLAISRHDPAPGRSDTRYPVIADEIAGPAGPLAGLLAALDWTAARDSAATHVVTVAVDTPFLPLDLVARLVAVARASGLPIACAASGGRIHPVAALWPVAIRRDLRDCVVADQVRRVTAILERFGSATADWPTDPHDPFLNVNTPEDLMRAEVVAVRSEDEEPQ